MRAPRHMGSLLVAGLVLGVAVIAGLAVRAPSQDSGLRSAEALSVCQAAHPAAGGALYLYVVDEQAHVLNILMNGALAASYTLPGEHAGNPGWYTVRAGRAEPAAGGDAYCFVIDPHLHKVHAFRNAEYLSTEDLPTEGQ